MDAGIVTDLHQGRHRYVQFADADIAHLIEMLASYLPPVAPTPSLRAVSTRAALTLARTCYDHLAGALGVQVTDALVDRGLLGGDGGWALTHRGSDWLESLGIDTDSLRSARRPLVRTCLDWTERRHHLAGVVGAALCNHFLTAGWVDRIGTDRGLRVTQIGRATLKKELGLTWNPSA